MSDRGVLAEEPAVAPAEPGANEKPTSPLPSIEQRVDRLEDAVAALQDTRLLEERVVARVGERLNRNPLPPVRDTAGILIQAGRRLLPAAIETIRTQAGTVEGQSRPATPPRRRAWLILDLLSELQTIARMYLDLRYRPFLSWTACLLPPLLLAAILTSAYWLKLLPGGSFIADTPLDKLLDLVLAVFLFKVLSLQSRRYQEMFPDLAAPPRP
jgi:hypothetical protein